MPGQIIFERDLGSANPVARFGRNVGSSFRGIAFGLIMIAAGFGLLWYAENLTKNSEIVAALPLTTATQATPALSGMVKIEGQPTVATPVFAPKTNKPALYYSIRTEEYKKIKQVTESTEVVQRNGRDIEQTIEDVSYVEEWSPLTREDRWAEFSLGNIRIQPDLATVPNAELVTVYSHEEQLPPAPQPASSEPDFYPATKKRTVVQAWDVQQPHVLVVGNAAGGVIAGGSPFIVTDKTNEALVASMQSAENKLYWGLKIAAWFSLTVGFVMLFGPLAVLLNIVPGLGSLFNTILFIIFGIVSALLVLLGTIIIRYWWVGLLVLAALIIGMILWRKKRG